MEQVKGLSEVDLPDFIGVGMLGVGDGCLVVQDVDGWQLREVHGLEVPPQLVGPWNGRFVARDEDVMTGLDVQVGDGLADEAGAASDDNVHVIRRVGGAQEKGRGVRPGDCGV